MIYENIHAHFLKLQLIYKEIRQKHFLLYAPRNSKELANPTRDRPELQRRAEVLEAEVTPLPGAATQVSRARNRRTPLWAGLEAGEKLICYSPVQAEHGLL